MRAVSSLVLFFVLIPTCVAQTPAPARYENLPGGAVYSNGYLLSWDNPQYTHVTVYGRDAKPAFSAPEQPDDSSPVMWAVDSDGVVAGAYWSRHPMEGRIDLLDLTGNVIRTIDTGSYVPQQVVFAPDHTIWTAAFDARRQGAQDFNVLHHYARTGEELGQALSWSQIGGDLKHPVIESIRGGRFLYVANDRIGWNAGLHIGYRTWIEVSFSGDVLGKYDMKTTDGLALMPLAMTANGDVYAMIFKSHSARFAVLDRSKGVWQKIAANPGNGLIGSEGDNLVFFSSQGGAWTTLTFVPSSSLRIEEPQE